MAWKVKTLKGGRVVMWEDVALGGTASTRYSSQFQVPAGRDFMIISNAAQCNTSGSCSDAMYAAYETGGTFYLVNKHLRASSGQGTSYNALDNTIRVRKWDLSQNTTVSPMGEFPYYKLAVIHAAVESTGKKIRFVVMYNAKAVPLAQGND